MKRFMKFMLAFVLTVMCLIPSVGAVKNAEGTGSIEISNALKDKTYSVYQILKLDSYADTNKDGKVDENDGFVYKTGVSDIWDTFVNSSEVKGVYFNVDAQNYVTWVENADIVAFSKLALKYAKDNQITATKSIKANADGKIEFTELNFGYYLVDSSLGALCAIGTTRPNVTLTEKNSVPTINKTVEENSSGTFGETNTAFIGETVNFKIEVNVGKGAESYVITDTLSNGLTLTASTIKVFKNSVEIVNAEDADYTMATTDRGFVITFTDDYVKTIAQNDKITVTYSAVLNVNAVVGSDGNDNTAKIEYGNNHSVTSTTTTYTYGFDIVKVDPNNNILVGAKFRLYDALTDGNQICLVKVSEGKYRVNHGGTSCAEIDGTNTGLIRIEGLDVDTYYVEETLNPDGYTKLLDRKKIEITDVNIYAQVNENTWTEGGLRIENTKGNLLPETGGMGTALFITLGSFMIVLFGILLVAKVRMSKENNN